MKHLKNCRIDSFLASFLRYPVGRGFSLSLRDWCCIPEKRFLYMQMGTRMNRILSRNHYDKTLSRVLLTLTTVGLLLSDVAFANSPRFVQAHKTGTLADQNGKQSIQAN